MKRPNELIKEHKGLYLSVPYNHGAQRKIIVEEGEKAKK